ncbi:MAG TPA: beta-galactosidase [Candidatus Limnocylindrales bacterium]|nr:beta-galactosidase [Candidatus Limnocylindrales bacterium]
MNTLSVGNGQFWLDDVPQFIHAAEFHYFRTPADQWAHRLGLLKDAGFNTVAAYIPWLWHQPELGLSDVDGHTHPMRNLAGFLDLAADMGFWIIARPGPYIMAETINEGIPPWMFAVNSHASFIDQFGHTQNIASYLHPDFLRCVDGWYKAVFEVLTPRQVTHGGRIVMIQLDNEMGMIQWVRNLVDTNPDTLVRFAGWLRQAYGERLSQRYPAADLTDFLREQITQPELSDGALVLEDYRRFYRAYLREYMLALWDMARAQGMDVPPVINIHGFGNGGKTFPIGLSQLVGVMELDGMVSATDVYPIYIGEGNFHQLLLVNEMTKALHNPQQPLFSIEFQAGGNQEFSGAQASLYDLHSRLCISSGMRAINHYLFFDGENDPVLSPMKRHDWGHPVRKDGTLRRHYARYPRLSRTLAAYGADLVLARPATVTTLGFQLDTFMTEVHNPLTRPAGDILTHQRDVILFDFLARGLALTQRPFDALELARARLDAAQTPVLWVAMDKQCDPVVQQKLVDYIQHGGRLILVGRLCDETFDHAPCTILCDAIGVQEAVSDPPFTPAHMHALDYREVPVSFRETYTGDFDTVFAVTADGKTVGFVQQVGQGQVMVLGAALAANTLDDLDILHQMANRMGCSPQFTLSDWADVRLSEGENGSFLFVSNYQDDPIETTISMAGSPLLGGRALSLAARRGVILPLEWQIRPGVTIHYLTSEVVDVIDVGQTLTLRMEPAEFFAELSLIDCHCDESLIIRRLIGHRVSLHGHHGVLELTAT